MIKRICTVLLFLAVVGIHSSIAQSIRGKIIYVHPSQVVKFKFRSSVDNYSFVNRDDARLFNVKPAGNRSLLINSVAQLSRSSNLVITEGGNTHLFILMSKNQLDAQTETVYDFSKRQDATDLVKNNNAGAQYVSKASVSGNVETKPAPVETSKPKETSKPTDGVNTVSESPAPVTVIPVSQTSVQKTTPPVDQKPTVSQKAVSNPPVTKAAGEVTATNSKAGVALPSNQKSTTSNEKLVEATPSWSDSVRYDLYVQAGDSLAWIARDYKNALKWYDSALRVRPDATLPKKQIKAVKQLQSQSDQLAAEKQRKDRFDNAMVHYKKADAFKTERKYPEAHQEYKQFLEIADTTKLSAYTSSQLYYINEAKDYVVRLQHYLPKPVVNTAPPPVADNQGKKKKGKKKKG